MAWTERTLPLHHHHNNNDEKERFKREMNRFKSTPSKKCRKRAKNRDAAGRATGWMVPRDLRRLDFTLFPNFIILSPPFLFDFN